MLKMYPFSKCDYSRNTARGSKGSDHIVSLTLRGLIIWRFVAIIKSVISVVEELQMPVLLRETDYYDLDGEKADWLMS
jgi:hypothetical protein